jgi:hypothetical protein
VQIVGAAAPSLRIDNAESGPTKRVGLGISTAANNFIQGSVDRDFCIFNGSTTASPILFGIYDTTNVAEAARISAARNFLIGTTTDSGYKFDVNGSARITGSFYADNTIRVGIGIIGTSSNNLALSSNTTGGEISFWNNQLANRLMTITGLGNVGIGIAAPTSISTFTTLEIRGATGAGIKLGKTATAQFNIHQDGTDAYFNNTQAGNIYFYTSDTERGRWTTSGNLLLGTGADAGYKLQVNGYIYTNQSLLIANTNIQYRLHTGNDGIELSAGVGGVYLDYGMTSWGSLSDERLKNIDSEILNATKSLMTLRTVRYSLKEDKRNKINLGLIAQDVVKVFPEAVDIQNNEIGTMGVRYTELIPVLVKAIQELNTKIENLK